MPVAERSRGRGLIGMDHERRATEIGDAQRSRPGLLQIRTQFALDVGQAAGARKQRLQVLRLIENLA